MQLKKDLLHGFWNKILKKISKEVLFMIREEMCPDMICDYKIKEHCHG